MSTDTPQSPIATATLDIQRDKGITAARGFAATGIAAGIKASGNKDLALVVNNGTERPAAAVFTTNKVKAAPVLWSQQVMASRELRAVVLNSGGANACTGPQGFADTHHTAEEVAAALTDLGTPTGAVEIAVCSTGLIGDFLPMPKVLAGVRTAASELSDNIEAGSSAAQAIMTTDSVPKQAACTHGDGWSVGGMAKGAGMLAPSLATMLCVVTTDAVATAEQLDTALRQATKYSFDRLDVDGATSTNDTVLLLSSGASGVSPSQRELNAAVAAICDDLADQLMADAEGVTKRVTVTVSGATSESEALIGARVVARDSLVKTALFGSDPNWGRVLAAIGIAPIALDPDKTSVYFNGNPVCLNGVGAPGAREVDLSDTDIALRIELGLGSGEATIRTTDLSLGYVTENSAYSS
ncbi:bifunctional glutamate N-acetyltransferase/amino-acid acetyltransferase ArgJ [Hoyosella rhizosphaerae]|uniref:Arginine biosynthesis bifunctional protein ArgJ n=1 Tax=Hoyosella rhizosphaerae TaxID=1755582 RepID=A0A916UF36_9ACTN|nr:bifunctional glutamate N-acetyltransferase/amino-acid acetyltransferase ArgJ [Hoyosella rhizosphaerae]MBN4925497.1 bifunctional glutamate N-acetyltransferase/amino-acid acetyltransferase ArgJ [Hoyosella rhizosphaerae]GGC70155.1 arginine biosynthesis bifunctional protein ArgJ [Hoyosella rhizosphaerae]